MAGERSQIRRISPDSLVSGICRVEGAQPSPKEITLDSSKEIMVVLGIPLELCFTNYEDLKTNHRFSK
jgi:hypothetical protein